MSKPSILVLSWSDLATDPRVNRQLQLLNSDFAVTAAGTKDPELAGVTFVPVPARRKTTARRLAAAMRLGLRRFASYYWHVDSVCSAWADLRSRRFDLIIANDADTWPLAEALRGSARVLLDAHEYAPREFEDRLYWRVLYRPYREWACRTCLPRADAVTTVCDGIADEYARVFRIARPSVVLNAPPRQPGQPRPTSAGRIRLVHHGIASPSRRIEVMIELMRHLDERFTLDLMLVESDARYAAALRRQAAGDPRIKFRPPVPRTEIIPVTREYDLGLFLLPPTNFNYRCALPNKFFEFVQARLGVAIGPSPEMARLVRQHQLGVVASSFEPTALARELQALDAPAIDRFKAASDRAAEVLCWENTRQILTSTVERLLPRSCAA